MVYMYVYKSRGRAVGIAAGGMQEDQGIGFLVPAGSRDFVSQVAQTQPHV
jgi:hypothetical protein